MRVRLDFLYFMFAWWRIGHGPRRRLSTAAGLVFAVQSMFHFNPLGFFRIIFGVFSHSSHLPKRVVAIAPTQPLKESGEIGSYFAITL